jgi:hypothetical protein
MGWRKNIFVEGKCYRVERPFSLKLWETWVFESGEILRFVRDYYSHYDGLSLYEFKSEPDGATKYWALPDDDSAEKWTEYFRPV